QFSGVLSPDGAALYGEYRFRDFEFPFTLSRAGAARIDPQPSSPPVTRDLEGQWTATVSTDGTEMHAVLKIVNHPDGKSTGTLMNLDEGSLELPIASIHQDGSDVMLRFTVLDASYAGVLNASSHELVGTWTQGTSSLSMTFRREVP